MGKKSTTQNIRLVNVKKSEDSGYTSIQKFVNDDWGTIAYIIPKSELDKIVIDEELKYNCVYFLFCTYNGFEQVYVGQSATRHNGKSILKRLPEHMKNIEEPFGDRWDVAVVFMNRDNRWDSADLDAIESMSIDDVPESVKLNRKKGKYLPDRTPYEDRLDQIKQYIKFRGFNLFSNYKEDANIQLIDDTVYEDANKPVENLQEEAKNKKKKDNKVKYIPEYITPQRAVKTTSDLPYSEIENNRAIFINKKGEIKEIDEIRIIDHACKGGEFLREFYDRLMNNEFMKAKYPNIIKRSNHILEHQIYGIATSQISKDRATTKLLGYGNNIKIIDNYIDLLKEDYLESKSEGTSKNTANLIKKMFRDEKGEEMDFDIVVGNPPYQDATSSIYQHFINLALDLNAKVVTMIVRNNWLTSDTLKDTRDRLINYGLKEVVNYSATGEVFPSVGVAVSVLHAQQGYGGGSNTTHIKEIRKGQIINELDVDLHGMPAIFMNSLDCSIVSKISSKNEDSFSKEVYPQEAFRITSVMGVGRKKNSYTLDYETAKSEEYNVAVLCQENSVPYYTWIRAEDIPGRSELVNQYKIVIGKVLSDSNNPLTSITALGPGAICAGSFAPVYMNKDIQQALSAYKYIKTRFFRYLVRILLTEGAIPHSIAKFDLVPIQNFTSNSSIDWSQSIYDIERQLYKKYNITQEEVTHIEKTIKFAVNLSITNWIEFYTNKYIEENNYKRYKPTSSNIMKEINDVLNSIKEKESSTGEKDNTVIELSNLALEEIQEILESLQRRQQISKISIVGQDFSSILGKNKYVKLNGKLTITDNV